MVCDFIATVEVIVAIPVEMTNEEKKYDQN